MRNRLAIIISLLLCLAVHIPADAISFRKLGIREYSIKSVTPQSLRSVAGSVELKIQNGGNALDIRNIQGTLYKNGKVFILGSAGDVQIAKGVSTVTVNGIARMGDEVGYMEFLQSLNFDPKDYTLDVSFDVVNRRGRATRISKKGIPLKYLVR